MKLKPLLLIVCLIAITANLFAQPAGMVLPKAPMPPMFPNTTMFGYQPTKKQRAIIKALSSPAEMAVYQAEQEFKFRVFYKDGTQKLVKGKIVANPDEGRSHLTYQQKGVDTVTIVYPRETYGISRVYNDDEVICNGIPTDSCWYFKISSGLINTYSPYADQELKDHLDINAIDAPDLPLKNFTPELLTGLIKDDSGTEKYLIKKEYLKAVKEYNKGHQPKNR